MPELDDLAGAPRPRASLVVAAATAAGLIAGLASGGAGEFAIRTFRPPTREVDLNGRKVQQAAPKDQAAADYKNATVANAILGALLGASLGLAGGLARRSPRAGLVAAGVGLGLGAALTAGASAALLLVYFRAQAESSEVDFQDLTVSLISQGGTWAVAGLAGGLALGIGLGRGRAAVVEGGVGGLLGGFLGAVVYLVGGTIAFPSDKIALPIPPDWPARLAGGLLAATLAGTVAALIASRGPRADHKAKGPAPDPDPDPS